MKSFYVKFLYNCDKLTSHKCFQEPSVLFILSFEFFFLTSKQITPWMSLPLTSGRLVSLTSCFYNLSLFMSYSGSLMIVLVSWCESLINARFDSHSKRIFVFVHIFVSGLGVCMSSYFYGNYRPTR